MPEKKLTLPLKLYQNALPIMLACSLIVCSGRSVSGIAKPVTGIATGAPLPFAQQPASKGVNVRVNDVQSREIGLQLAEARRGFLYKTVVSPGQVQPNAELSTLVSTPSAGRAIKVLARLGETVKAGQLMAIIKSDPIGQVQSDLLQNVLQTKSDIKQQEVALELDRITYERESVLFKEQVSAHADLQAAENTLKKDETLRVALEAKKAAYIKVAQERLTLLGAPPDSAQKVVDTNKLDPWVYVRAPRAGLVIERAINPGELSDGTHELFTLANLSEVWLVANIFEKDVQSVKMGQQAFVTLDSFPDRHFPAKIVWVGDTLNPTTRTLPVRANVANPQLTLKPNMFARINVNVGKETVLLVPIMSVVQKGDKSLVFVKTANGTFSEREVTTGDVDEKDVQILSGLTPGQIVVSQGSTELLGEAMKTSEGR